MLGLTCTDYTTQLFQLLDDILIGIFHILTFEVSHWIHKFASLVDWADNFLISINDACSQTNAVVIFSKIWSLKQ